MVAMIFFTTIQVAFRVFFTAFSWTEEITCFLLVYASLVGTAVAFKRGSHIAVTFLAQRLPGAGQKFLAVGVHLLGIAFFAVMVIYGALLMGTESQQLSPGMQVPMAWVYVAFPAVGTVIILHLLAGIRQTLGKG
jgi:TRAP-type C4-dicarboxylate transport system permease small subunit